MYMYVYVFLSNRQSKLVDIETNWYMILSVYFGVMEGGRMSFIYNENAGNKIIINVTKLGTISFWRQLK